MNIQRFTKERAQAAHNGTILASAFVPEGMRAPFGSAWGYMEPGKAMESHRHPTQEIYVVISGRGVVTVDREQADVRPGDVIDIPPDANHTIAAAGLDPLLWAALWWEVE